MLVRASSLRACSFLLLLAIGSAAPAVPQPLPEERGLPFIRNFPPRTYRGHDQVWAIAPGPAGTLFFGNENQVFEYDGLHWRPIAVPGASFIRALATDAAGTVWVAGVNELGRLVARPDGRFEFESLRRHLPSGYEDLGAIWCLHALPDGIWFQSNSVLLRWRGDQFDAWPLRESRTVLSYRLGSTLLVARASGWFSPEPGGTWRQLGDAALGETLPRFVLEDSAGGWIVGTGTQGLQHFDGTRLTPRPTAFDDWLKTKKLYRAERLPDGRLVLCSLQGGALVLDPALRPQWLLDENSGLLSDTVISAAMDRFGALWLGTDAGICRVDLASPVTRFGPAHGIGRNGAETLARLDGRIVVGGARGMMALNRPTSPLAVPQFQPVLKSLERFNVFHPLPDGALAGGLTGLHWQHAGESTPIVTATRRSLSGVREIVASQHHPGRFYVVHLNGIAWLERRGAAWHLGTNWTEPNAEVRCLVEDSDAALWVTTPNSGVLRLRVPPDLTQPLALERFGADAGLPIERQRVWITLVHGAPLFHFERGFFRFDPATRRFRPETRYGARFHDGSTFVRELAADDRGGLWVTTEPEATTELRLLHVPAGGEAIPFALPDAEQIGSINYIHWERHTGRETIWLGGQHSVLHLDVSAWRSRVPVAIGSTLLREVSAGASAGTRLNLAAKDEPRLPAAQNTLRFRFGTPGLAGEPDARHETQLIGFGRGALELGPGGERTFTNLSPGSYTFSVRGRSADGRWSDPATFAFRILAPWWQTAWAFSGYALLLAAGIYGIIRRRTRTLERERNRLETVVSARTVELAQKNAELERLNRIEQDEKLAARLAEEKARLELLRYQLNPHFLFNSLNSIRALVYANPAAAGEMVTRLAEFCRWTLTRGSDETTTVADEADMVRTYLDIEKVRWQDALSVSVEADPAALTERLPQFLLLPLIENAIKYGGQTSPGTLTVRVALRLEGSRLIAEVANSGSWVEPSSTPTSTSTHIGLENLRQRLARHYGTDWQFDITRDPGWVRLQLRLPRGLAAVPRHVTSRDPFPVKP